MPEHNPTCPICKGEEPECYPGLRYYSCEKRKMMKVKTLKEANENWKPCVEA